MNTKIWLEELSFGPNFGNLHPIGSSRVWWYFLAHIFKIKKVWIDFIKRFPRYSKVGINFIRLFLRKSSCVPVQISEFRFPLYAAFNYLYPFSSFSVYKFCGRTDRQTDWHSFLEKVLFFLTDQEYIHMSIPISIIFQISRPCDQS